MTRSGLIGQRTAERKTMARDDLEKAEKAWQGRALFNKKRERPWGAIAWLSLSLALAAVLLYVFGPSLIQVLSA